MIVVGLALRLWVLGTAAVGSSAEGVPSDGSDAVSAPGTSPMPVASSAPSDTSPAPVASSVAPDVALSPSTETARPSAANLLFLQALGSGLFYSLNYERYVDAWRVGFRLGGSFFSLPVSKYGASENLVVLTFPLTASYYVGARNHKLQLGLGATFLYTYASTDTEGIRFENERTGFGVAATAVVGYRYIPSDGGFSFGAAFTPLLRTTKFLPWGGIDVGYAF